MRRQKAKIFAVLGAWGSFTTFTSQAIVQHRWGWAVAGFLLSCAAAFFGRYLLDQLADPNRVTAYRAPRPRDGICGDKGPYVAADDPTGKIRTICCLDYGHPSAWHEAEDGQQWTWALAPWGPF